MDRRIQLLSAFQEVELHDEDVPEQITAELADEIAGCRCAPAWNTVLC